MENGDHVRNSATTGATVWLTGLPSSGKSTLASAVAEVLREDGTLVEILDGDEIRAALSSDLGFSRADRDKNVRRIGWVSRLLARNGIVVLVPVIAPYAATRDEVRSAHSLENVPFIEVHVATPVEVCAQRDVKGLYAMQARGEIRGLTGVDDPYQAPLAPELHIDAHLQTVDESTVTVTSAIRSRLSIQARHPRSRSLSPVADIRPAIDA